MNRGLRELREFFWGLGHWALEAWIFLGLRGTPRPFYVVVQ